MSKHIKIFLFSLIAVFFLYSCKPTTSSLENEVKKLANEKLFGTGVQATDVTLIHKGGNDYSGTITLCADGLEEEYNINVVCDGRNFQYEILDLD